MKQFIILNLVLAGFIFCSDEDQGDVDSCSISRSFLSHAYPTRYYPNIDLELEDRLKVHAHYHKNKSEDAFSHLLVIHECIQRQKMDNKYGIRRAASYTDKEIEELQKIFRYIDADRTKKSKPKRSEGDEDQGDNDYHPQELLHNIFNFLNFETKALYQK